MDDILEFKIFINGKILTCGHPLVPIKPEPFLIGQVEFVILNDKEEQELIAIEFGNCQDSDAFAVFEDNGPEVNLLPAEILGILVQRKKFIRGDANNDGVVDISDPIFTLGVLFLGEGFIQCPNAADANDDNQIDISDPINILSSLFQDGLPLPEPYPEPGYDRNFISPDNTGCEGF